MSLVDELQRLEELYQRGTLSADEFQQAKTALLAGGTPTNEAVVNQMSDQLAEVRYQNELVRIDREWEIEKEQYLITTRYGRRLVPTQGAGIITAVVGGGFGIFWTIMAVFMASNAPDFGPMSMMTCIFPVFGVLFIIAAIGWGVYAYNKANAYQRAFEAYQQRRRDVTPAQFHG